MRLAVGQGRGAMCDCCAILRKCVGREGRDAITNPHTETVSEMCFSRMTSCICTVGQQGCWLRAPAKQMLLQPWLSRKNHIPAASGT